MSRVAPLNFLAGLAFLSVGAAAVAGELELIERLPGAIDEHTMVMLDGSRAMVAWERDDSPAHESVWTSRRNDSGRWDVPEIIEFSQGHARGLQIAADGAGVVTVIWVQQEMGLSGLWANRYFPDEGWQQPVRVEPVAGELYAPRLAIDSSGRGFAVWERRQGDRLGVRASRYTPENGWGPPRDIDAGAGDSVSPRLAVHTDDSAIAVWSRRDGTGNRRVTTARFDPSEGWGPPEEISAVGEDAYDVQIAMDAFGNAITTWEQETEGEETILARRFDARNGWSAQVRLEIHGEEGYAPRLAVSPDGSAVVVWIRADGEAGTVVAARFTPEGGWERALTVQGGELLYVFDLHVAANSRGDVLAAWVQTDGSRNNIWYARFDSETAWGAPALAEKRTGSAHRPRAAGGPTRSFGLVWKTVDAPLPDQALYSLWFRLVPREGNMRE